MQGLNFWHIAYCQFNEICQKFDVCRCGIFQGGRLGTLVTSHIPLNSTNVMKDRIIYLSHIILLAMFGREI